MSAASLQILIDVRAKLDELTKSQSALRDLGREATSTGQALKTGFGIDIARRGLDILTSSLKSAVAESFRLAGQIKDASEALGISATIYQVLIQQMADAGVEEARLTMAISSQTKSLAAARDATSSSAKAYRDLGLSAASIELLPVEQRLIAVARAAVTAKDQTAAFDAAAAILGDRGLAKLLNALKILGVEGVPVFEELYQKQGRIMSADTMNRLDLLAKAWKALWREIVNGGGESVAMLDRFTTSAGKDFWGAMGDLIKVGPMGMNRGPLATRLSIDNPEKPAAAAPDPNAIVEAQARSAANMAAAENARALAKSNAEAAEAAAKKMIAAQEWAATLAREYTADLKRQGEEMRKSVLTPNEEYGEKVRKLSQLHAQGAIDATTFQRAVAAANDELDKKIEPEPEDRWRRPSGVREGAQDWVDNIGTAGEQAAGALQSTLGATVQGITDGIYGWITGAQSAGEAMLQLGGSVLRTILQTIVEIGVRMMINALLSRSIQAAAIAANIAMASATAVALSMIWAAPATLATIATLGGAAAAAPAEIMMAKMTTLASSAGGFAGGGYTGDGPTNQVAGVVHGQEGVLNAPAMRRLGRGFLDAANAGAPLSVAASAAPALSSSLGAAGGGGGGRGRESVRNTYILLDKEQYARLMQEQSGAWFKEMHAAEMRRNS